DGRSDIGITGCGPRSLLAAAPGNADAAVLTIRNSSNIRVHDLGLEALAVPAIRIDGNEDAPVGGTVLDALAIRARAVVAVVGTGLRGFEMGECDIVLLPLALSLADDPAVGRQPAVYLSGDDLSVEGCRIEVGADAAAARQPLGGIQIGGGSNRV